ncbi:MAG: Lrp/AsnC family transcriptional regulator [Candidatus Thermoplasmatota archaeon]|nr:Lrp/AsnC family transcriptional regulator [Candidatus Thermoplasmatota archaeon]
MNNVKQDLDAKILKLLKEDARRSNVLIARELGVSEGMVRQRIGRMREDGTIRKFTIETSSRGLKAIIEINIEVNVHTTLIAQRIRSLPGVEKVYEASGITDIIAFLDVDDTAMLNDTIEAIRALGPITNTRTKLVLGEL